MRLTLARHFSDSRWDKDMGCRILTGFSRRILIAILFFSNLACGAVHTSPLYIVNLLIAAASALQIVLVFSEKNYLSAFHKSLGLPTLLFLFFLAAVSAQFFFGLAILNGFPVGAINRYATLCGLRQLTAYLLFFVLCYKTLSNKGTIEKIVSEISVLIFLITLWGIAETLLHREILWHPHNPAQFGFGPFINPNHYGAMVNLALPLLWAVFIDRFSRTPSSKAKKWTKWIRWMDSDIIWILFVTTLSILSCFLSESRLGSFTILFSLAAYFFFQKDKKFHVLFLIVTGIILGGSALLLNQIGWETIDRTYGIQSLFSALAERLQVASESLKIFYRYPLWGTGLGTFYFISSKFISVMGDSLIWNHAHNDYVELLAETGGIGFGLFILSVLVLMLSSLRHYQKNTSAWNRIFCLQAFMALFNIGVMELADFNLKIPSLALLFVFQLAILHRVSHSEWSDKDLRDPLKDRPPTPLGKSVKWGLAGSFLMLTLVLFFLSTQEFLSSQAAEKKWNKIYHLKKSVEIQPLNSENWQRLGTAYLEKSRRTQSHSKSQRYQKKALKAFRSAVSLSPTFARHWFALGLLEYRLAYKKEGLSSLEKAVRCSPWRSGYFLHLMALYLYESDHAPSDEQKEHYLKMAEKLFRSSKSFSFTQDPDVQKQWMGDYYYRMFQRLISQWSANGA